jgi:hypothetical protein
VYDIERKDGRSAFVCEAHLSSALAEVSEDEIAAVRGTWSEWA